jgi:molybdopterin-binding protein
LKYQFASWENGETNSTRTITLDTDMVVTASYSAVTRRLTFKSSPINVQAVVDGQTINAGEAIDLPEGTVITITVPREVTTP